MDKTSAKLVDELRALDVMTDPETKDSDCIPSAVKKTVCYIVSTVVVKDDTVLMMKEARADCYGAWYLPAGKVEPNEPLSDAAAREVLEETGLEVSLSSLIAVENAFGGFWYRFTFAGCVTGGELKDESKKDKESLEAAWVPIEDVRNKKLRLRANDAVKLIELGEKWYKSSKNDPKYHTLPIQNCHIICCLRIFLMKKEHDDVSVYVTMPTNQTLLSLPEVKLDNVSSRFGIETSLHSTLLEAGFYGNAIVRGLLSVEHCPSEFFSSEGVCFNVVCEADLESGKAFHENKGKFLALEETRAELHDMIDTKAWVDLLFL